jgi:hypothetical protein
MLMQILWPTSNRPLGVNILTSGGLNAAHVSMLHMSCHTVFAGEHDEAVVLPAGIWRVWRSALDTVSLRPSLISLCGSRL